MPRQKFTFSTLPLLTGNVPTSKYDVSIFNKNNRGVYSYTCKHGRTMDHFSKADDNSDLDRLALKSFFQVLRDYGHSKNKSILIRTDNQYLIKTFTTKKLLAKRGRNGFVDNEGNKLKNVDLLKVIVRRLEGFSNIFFVEEKVEN